jgi:hypothetical protein
MTSKDKAYLVVSSLRRYPVSSGIPILLVVDIPLDDIKTIGLCQTRYGTGLGKLIEGLAGDVADVTAIKTYREKQP